MPPPDTIAISATAGALLGETFRQTASGADPVPWAVPRDIFGGRITIFSPSTLPARDACRLMQALTPREPPEGGGKEPSR